MLRVIQVAREAPTGQAVPQIFVTVPSFPPKASPDQENHPAQERSSHEPSEQDATAKKQCQPIRVLAGGYDVLVGQHQAEVGPGQDPAPGATWVITVESGLQHCTRLIRLAEQRTG